MTAIEFIMQFIKGGSATDVSTSGTDQLPTGVHDSSGARIDPVKQSEYLFSERQATLNDGEEIVSGWLDMENTDKWQGEFGADTAGLTQVIETSSEADGAGYTITSNTVVDTTFQLFNVIVRQRYLRIRWQNNTGAAVTNCYAAIKVSYGSSDKLSVFPVNVAPTDFSQAALVQSVNRSFNPNMEFISTAASGPSDANSTQTPLGAGGTFVGDYADVRGQNSLLAFAISDAPLADIQLQWSPDGVNSRTGLLSTSDFTASVTELAGFYIYLTVVTTLVDEYVRLEVTNGATPQTIFEADTWISNSPFSGTYLAPTDTISSLTTALLTRAIGVGLNPDGEYTNSTNQGINSANSSSTPLNAGGIFRGVWREWLSSEVELVSSITADVAGTLYIDFSDVETPTDGDDSSVEASITVPYDPNVTALTRRTSPVQSRWVRHRYINGAAGQSSFQLNAGMLVAASGLVKTELATLPDAANLAGIVRSVNAISDGAGGFQEVPVDTNGTPTVSVESINDDVLLRPLPSWDVSQRTVTASPVLLDAVKLSGRRAVQVKNHDTTNNVWIGPDNTLTQSNGELIPPLQSSGMILSESGDVYAIGPAGSTTAEYRRDGTTATGTAASPSNALTSDDTRAVYSAAAQTVEIDGYTAGTTNAINLIHLCVEGRKASTPATQTVAWLGVTTGTGSTGTATASSVPAGTNVLYVADVSIENTNSVTGVSGGSLTWTKENSSSIGSAVRTSRWWAYGSPGAAFNVTASLNAAGNHNIAVNRYSGAHSTTPFENTEVSTSSSSSYSDALNGTALGMVAVAVAFGDKPHTPGSGATERSETTIGSGGNAVSLATTTEAITVTGSQTYAGTFSGSGDWAALASCIVPAPTLDPTLTLSYELSGVPGSTSGVVTFTSTTDATFETVDITGDEAWAYTDVPNITVIGTATSVPVNIEVDRLYLLIEDSSGTTVRVSIKEMA